MSTVLPARRAMGAQGVRHPVAAAPRALRWSGRQAWLLLPVLLFFGFFYLLPLADLLRQSVAGEPWHAFYRRALAPLYLASLWRTFGIAAAVTAICALLGYPTALCLHRARRGWALVLTAAVVLPYFVSVLIRSYAWMVLLGRNGPVNRLLVALGLVDAPLSLMYTRGAVLVSISAVLLPLTVLTVRAALARADMAAVRAATACGAAPLAAFWRVLFPQTVPGLLAGSMLVFIGALGFFITPALVGGPADQTFAMHITQQADFLAAGGFLQALAVVLLVVTLAAVALAARFLGLGFIWGAPRAAALRQGGGAPAPWRQTLALRLDRLGWPLLRALAAVPAFAARGAVGLLATLGLGALLLPIAAAVVISFSSAVYMRFPPPGFSLRWYTQFFGDAAWTDALLTSLGVALLSAVIAVALGTAAALALVRGRLPGQALWMALLVSPLVVPAVVLGLSLYTLYLRTGLLGTPWGLAAAQAIGGIPLVLVIVSASLQSVDPRVERAAAAHGASPWRVFRHVTLPAIRPGLLAAGLFAFLHAFDDLVLAMFLAGARLSTLPLRLWGNVHYKLDPLPAVVAALEVAAIVAVLCLWQAARARRAGPPREAA